LKNYHQIIFDRKARLLIFSFSSAIIIKRQNIRKIATEINGGINNMAQITKDTIIGDILDMDNTTAPFFLEMGMHCLGCPASRGETVAEACMVHGVDADELIKKINAHLAK